jgi:hypothetical protein
LIATSRKPNTRSVPGARWPRAGFQLRSGSAPQAVVDGRRLRTILVGLGLAALTGLTTWAVASVSIWLVPAYLLLMVLIFAMPRSERAGSPATGPSAGTSGADAAESGQGLGEDRAVEMGEPRPTAEPIPGIPTGEAAEAPTPRPDPAGAATAKPRRSRARSRKAAKTAVEPVPDASPVTWIRVGPGKFVRADAGVQDFPQAQAEAVAPATDAPEIAAAPSDIAAGANPVIDALEGVAPAPWSPVPFEVPAEPVPLDPLEATPDGEETVPSSVEDVSGSVAEEYGIAPSAFGSETPDFPAAEGLDHGVFEELVPPRADPVCIAGPDGLPSGRDARSGRLGSRRQRSWARTAFLPAGIANGSPGRGSDPASSRRRVRSRPGPRTALRCSSPRDARLRQAARRASGRTRHVQRAFRSRSPPRRSA